MECIRQVRDSLFHIPAQEVALTPVSVAGMSFAEAHEKFVGRIDEEPAFLGENMVIQGAFRGNDILIRAETFQVGMSDIGNDSIIRIGDVTKHFNFTRVVGAHLHDAELGIFIHGKQGEGYSDMIVQIALRGRHLIFAGQDGMAEFLCRGLSVGTGNAENRDAEPATVVMCQFLQALQCVRNQEPMLSRLRGLVDDERRTAPCARADAA